MTRSTDERVLEARVPDGPPEFRFRTAPGVHSHDEFRTGELLALEGIWERDPAHLLVVEATYGVVGVVAAATADVTMTEMSARAATLCERNAALNGVEADVRLVEKVTSLEGTFSDGAYVPKPYTPIEMGKQHVADALSTLEPGGALLLAARTGTGLSRYETCLESLAPAVETVTGRDGWRLLAATVPESFDPPTYVERNELSVSLEGIDLALVSQPGLFSANELDEGTRLLAETVPVADGERVLDLCCGYGALGAYAAASADCEVWLTDDDRCATACADRTLAANGLEGEVVTADATDGVADREFDRIVSNPPTHAGAAVLDDLFGGAADLLAHGGSLWFVRHEALDLTEHLGAFDEVRTEARGEEHVVRSART